MGRILSMACAALLTLLLMGTGPDARPGWEVRLEIEGEARRAWVVPDDGSLEHPPMLMYFHGRGGTLDFEREYHVFDELWPEAVIVYMEGTPVDASGAVPDAGGRNGWTLRFPYKAKLGQTRDLDYVRAVRERVVRRYGVDDARVYAAGHSSGGFFVLSLAELMPESFAGFAVVGAYARYRVEDASSPGNRESRAMPLDPEQDRAAVPRPIFYAFGEQDDVFNNDAGSRGWPGWAAEGPSLCRATLQQLLIRNGCPPPRDADWWRRRGLHVFEPRDATGAPVGFRLHEGDHGWPRGVDGADRWVVDWFRHLPR
ncbi:MAG: hypothetical protein KDA21_12895 [Phycisphaerales bacterium]|nr:hypothetical protein [Phycisphaerales bacterium]